MVETILKTAKDGSGDDYWRSRMEGHCMKVDKDILPEFYALCQEVKQQLNFKEPVDFYVTGDSTLNAFSVAAEDEGHRFDPWSGKEDRRSWGAGRDLESNVFSLWHCP